MELTIDIPLDEWRVASTLLSIIDDDERSRLGVVRLQSDGHRRRWYATDSYRVMCIDGGADDRAYDLAIPPGAVAFAYVAAGVADSVELTARREGQRYELELSGPGGAARIDGPELGFVDAEGCLSDEMDLAAHGRITADDLGRLVHTRLRRVVPSDDEVAQFSEPPMFFQIAEGTVQTTVDWPGVGEVAYSVPLESGDGDCGLFVNPALLESLLRMFDGDETLEVQIPMYVAKPLRLVGASRRAALMPIRTPIQTLRDRVVDVVGEVAGHLAVVPDADGDFPLRRHGKRVYGRFVADVEPAVFQVFAVLLDGVELTGDLCLELNDLNQSVGFARLFHVGSQVLAEVDLLASTLDAPELATAIERISSLATDITPMLAAVFGGTETGDPHALRWTYYRSAVLEAEVLPGRLAELNGPDAIDEWPFPGQVHVLTGWNPQGISLGESSQDEINAKIAADVMRFDGRFVSGFGRSPDGQHAEPSLFAWNLTRDEAVELGRRASQDAIFEIDADEVRLVSCLDDTVACWPRLA